MRRLALLALLVPLVAGCGFFGGGWSPFPAPRVLPSAPVMPVPRWIAEERLPRKAIAGAKLFATSGCLACHTYAGSGAANLHAPDLTAIGTRHLGIAFEIRHLRCPFCVSPGSPMPAFRRLGSKRLRQLAIFLEDSKGLR